MKSEIYYLGIKSVGCKYYIYINSIPNTYGNDVDIMVEAKAKELSILPFINSNKCEYSGLLNTASYE